MKKFTAIWQPIETAPRDGTDILILSQEGTMWVGSKCNWDSCDAWHYQNPNYKWHYQNDSYQPNEIPSPTQWMPLPEAPVIYPHINIIGAPDQTEVVNNILTSPAGSAGTDCNGYRSITLQIIPTTSTITGKIYYEYSNDQTKTNWSLQAEITILNGEWTLKIIDWWGNMIPFMPVVLDPRLISLPLYGSDMRARIVKPITGGAIQVNTRLDKTPID